MEPIILTDAQSVWAIVVAIHALGSLGDICHAGDIIVPHQRLEGVAK